MKVRRAAEIVQVEMRILQIESGARIGQNLALLGKGKDHGHAGILTWKAFHARNVNATFRQTLHAKFPEWITSNARSETNAAAQERDIVGKDCRRAAEGHRKIVGQMFSLGFKYWRKTVQNQIAIKFTQNIYVKTLHSVVSLFLQQFYLNALLNARNFLSQNATRECRQAIRRTASYCER